jgi:DNA repair photolyase
MSRKFLGHQNFKGRGTLSNPIGRFEKTGREEVDDGWYQEEAPAHIDEVVMPDKARTVISANDSPDVGFEYSINPYRGCSHACVYCFARPSHAYMDLSPGLDFETKLFYKENAAQLLEKELAKPRYVPKPIALGINTDGYQPLEKRLTVTRSILEVLARTRHPVSIITKSALVVRDLDLLTDMARDNLVSVAVSVTSMSAEIKRTLEPRTASPQARLRTIQTLADAGVPVGVMVAPVIPAITDHEMEAILQAAAEAGATTAGYVLLRLPYEIKDLFREWLAEHYPDRAKHVMSLINQARGGRDNDPRFGTRMRGTGAYADLLRNRFQLATRKLGLNDARNRMELQTALFRPPAAAVPQMSLGFD